MRINCDNAIGLSAKSELLAEHLESEFNTLELFDQKRHT